jgi:hypothetical protein
MHKGFYKLDPLKSQGENMAQTVIVAEESTHLQQDILPSPLDSIMGVVCFPFPIQFCKRITSSTVFQGLIIGAIVLAGFLVGLNTYLDCDFPKASTCWSDRFGQVLQAKRPCVSDNQAGADGLEASSWADEVWDNERGIYATTEVICHAQGCCFDGTKSTTRNETNCWKREAFPECFSGAGIDHASQAIQIIDQVILYLFTLECVLTIISHGKPFWRYFKNPWNMFDFVVVVLCYVDIGGNPAVLRLLRLMRIIKLLVRWWDLKSTKIALEHPYFSKTAAGLLSPAVAEICRRTAADFDGSRGWHTEPRIYHDLACDGVLSVCHNGNHVF